MLIALQNTNNTKNPVVATTRNFCSPCHGVYTDASFRQGHYDVPNLLAHVRFDDRQGPNNEKVLFMEEIQSDWHQQGRDKGYHSETKTAKPVKVEWGEEAENVLQSEKKRREVKVEFSDGYVHEFTAWVNLSDEQVMESAARRRAELGETPVAGAIRGVGVPDAPFKNSWPLLVFKRMIRWAAENNYDSIAWTTGEMQADRYDLTKFIDAIGYEKRGKLYNISVWDKEGRLVWGDQSADERMLESHLGKELARKVVAGEGEKPEVAKGMREDLRSPLQRDLKYLRDVDLKVGGEGMKAFYDRMLPSIVNKYVKKWGIKVDKGLAGLDKGHVWSIPVTTEMRQSAMAGQPLFSRNTVYHGTNAGISAEELKLKNGMLYFSSDPAYAANYGDNVLKAQINIENPLDFRSVFERGNELVSADRMMKFLKDHGIDIQLSGTNEVLHWVKDGTIAKAAKEAGYDGMFLNEYHAETGKAGIGEVVFNEDQVTPLEMNEQEADQANLPLPPDNNESYAERNRRIREQDVTAWTKTRTYLKRQFAPGGLLPQLAFDEKVHRDAEWNVGEREVFRLVRRLEKAVKKDYKKGWSIFDNGNDVVTKKVNDALHDTGQMDNLEPATRDAVLAMRQYIDGLSDQYVGILDQEIQELLAKNEVFAHIAGQDSAEYMRTAKERARLLEIISRNRGKYVTRSYRAFSDPKWAKKVPDDVLNDARAYLKSRNPNLGDNGADRIINHILKDGTSYDSMESWIKESVLGEKDLSILKKRKEIAPEIRALLGEHTDPRLNFAITSTKMNRLIFNDRFLKNLRDKGEGVFLWKNESDGPPDLVQLKPEESASYMPLSGYWVTRETRRAFKDSLDKEHLDGWYRTIVQMNGLVKAGKTILAPTTAARNWQSAMMFAVFNGHFNFLKISKSVEGLKEYFTAGGDQAKIDYQNKLLRLGVILDNPYAGEMMRLLDDSGITDKLLAGKENPATKLWQFAQRFYQYGDDFWKIMGWENEKRNLMQAGFSEADAEVEAAERIRNTYPTYSMVGKAIKSLRRFPLAGTFVSFPAEIIRTTMNHMYYMAKDYKAGRVGLATRRAIGLAAASSFAFAIHAFTKHLLGLDDEEEEALRLLAAPWQRNSNFWFTGRTDKGNLTYIDISYVDPYNYWKRPITAIMRDQPWEDKFVEVRQGNPHPVSGDRHCGGGDLRGPVQSERNRRSGIHGT